MLAQSINSFLCLAFLTLACILVKGEFYSSIDTMQRLEQVEKELVAATRLYFTEQQQQLQLYRNFVANVKREHAIGKEQGVDYWDEPLQSFRLTKRLVEDWETLHVQLEKNPPKDNYKLYLEAVTKELGLPNLRDLQGTVRGLVSLQNIYNLTAADLAEGNINGFNTDVVLLWQDCFEIGVQLYDLGEYNSALEWLVQAANMLNEMEMEDALPFILEVYEYLALTYIELGEKGLALEMLNDLLAWDPDHSAQHTLTYLQQTEPKCPKTVSKEPWFDRYTQLCQGKHLPETEPSSGSLSCYLDSQRDALFRLAPLKVEPVHLNPDINIYHDVLNDAQIDSIFEKADELQMLRSTVGGSQVTDKRVSQQVWLNYSSPIMNTVSQLVGAISGLNMSNAEIMQVANYGIGGQYVPHLDYFSRVPQQYKDKGNRIATSMFYLSDVVQGGYTVFPQLNVILKPIKGALVMWHNQLRSLTEDPRTQHAGCPVIEGSKRIGNIWIHSGYQEFKRPCSLDQFE